MQLKKYLSTYKLCLQDIQGHPNSQPRQVPILVRELLKQVWKQKLMAPRVQTFAWRLLRKALLTGMRVGRFSVHITSECCRCSQQEDGLYLFYHCAFARAALFGHPWTLDLMSLLPITILCNMSFKLC